MKLVLTKEEKKEIARNKRLYRLYGWDIVFWNNVFEEQGRVCAICKTMPKSGILSVDHAHIKGFKKMPPEEKFKYTRGLVCFLCNTSFGRIERRANPRKLLNNIIEYFGKYGMKGDNFED